MNIYESCPALESEKYIIRLFKDGDIDDLFRVYSDKNALPFFNSDNCDGDNFYYSTKERMSEAIAFWHMAYENGWFARLSIVDKATSGIIGTVEFCLRVSDDEFDHMGVLRVDVRSDYEEETVLYDIFALVAPKLGDMPGCKGVLTKAPIYAAERIKAVQKAGFWKSGYLLTGKNGYAYDGYWTYE